MTYDLYPSAELAALRARFTDYQVCAFHDQHGRPYLCAVLFPEHLDSGLPVLITATSIAALGARLAAIRDLHTSQKAVPAIRNSSRRHGGPEADGGQGGSIPASPPSAPDADLTRRLRDAICTLRDRGLLPRWQPSQSLLSSPAPVSVPAQSPTPVPAQRLPVERTDQD
ncbi:hypothetical protein CLV63_11951 [Murinocardiopsis flavida]|uniref:Uncharacterized protein n=1 Tax=Murinocardiopsis flavida TaxID=645275 RepID=A0A2P8D3H7_9ACTN|nr:hypothetical protein [Murinocardiopsis flavida]PSK91770.1 hypothetical protein CLV63_11951 [Murinocardiopsis flavida]